MKILFLVAALAACSGQDMPQAALLLAEHKPTHAKFFEARADELGLRVITLAADNDVAQQSAQVERVLAQGVKVLVIEPIESQAAARYVRLAHEKGAKVIAYDRPIIAPDLDYYVAHDSYRVGVLQAQAALRATSNKGKYVILAGEAGDSVSNEITRGYKDTLAPYIARDEVEVVVEQYHSGAWLPERAQRTVEDALARTHNQVDAILANNSAMARGAVQAIRSAGLAGVFIAGADADEANVKLVCQGKQTIEVFKDVEPLAKTAAETAKLLYAGESPMAGSSIQFAGKSVPVAAVRVEVVTSDNCNKLLADAR